MTSIIVYHRTFGSQAIVREGFRDAAGPYGTGARSRGVWVSDCLLDLCDGADGDGVLAVAVPEAELAPYEWVEEGRLYREFLVPAALLNQYGPPVMVDEGGEAVPPLQQEAAETGGALTVEQTFPSLLALRKPDLIKLCRVLGISVRLRGKGGQWRFLRKEALARCIRQAARRNAPEVLARYLQTFTALR